MMAAALGSLRMREYERAYVIQLEVDDALLQQIGSSAVRTFIERQLSLLRLQYLGKRIAKEIQQSGLDHELELAEAREDAWREKWRKDNDDESFAGSELQGDAALAWRN